MFVNITGLKFLNNDKIERNAVRSTESALELER